MIIEINRTGSMYCSVLRFKELSFTECKALDPGPTEVPAAFGRKDAVDRSCCNKKG